MRIGRGNIWGSEGLPCLRRDCLACSRLIKSKAFRRSASPADVQIVLGAVDSKSFRRSLRELMRLTFCDQKVSKKSPATSPPGCAGCPAVLDSGGSRRTRCAQTCGVSDCHHKRHLPLRASADHTLTKVKTTRGQVHFVILLNTLCKLIAGKINKNPDVFIQ